MRTRHKKVLIRNPEMMIPKLDGSIILRSQENRMFGSGMDSCGSG
jgi:hypothetical protein